MNSNKAMKRNASVQAANATPVKASSLAKAASVEIQTRNSKFPRTQHMIHEDELSTILFALERNTRTTGLPCGKRIKINHLALNSNSKFGFDLILNDKSGHLAYIPLGDKGDFFIFDKVAQLVNEGDVDVDQPESDFVDALVSILEDDMYIPNAYARVLDAVRVGSNNFRFAGYATATFATKADTNTRFGEVYKDLGAIKATVDGSVEDFYQLAMVTESLRISDVEKDRTLNDFETRIEALESGQGLLQTQLRAQTHHVSQINEDVTKQSADIHNLNGMNVEFHLAVHSLTTRFNDEIRSTPESQWDFSTRMQVQRVDRILRDLPVHIGEVYRGLQLEAMEMRFPGWYHSVLRNGYTDKAFICATTDPNQALKFGMDEDFNGTPVVLRIQQRTGRYIAPFVATEFKAEEEILFPRNTVLRCINALENFQFLLPNGATKIGRVVYMVEI
jgi:hypothetical protein